MARNQGSDDLFRLIRALNPEEKSYFKKFAKRHSTDKKKYLQLFDAINAQKEFEETSLKRKFTGLSDMKAYLFAMILKSLLAYTNDFKKPEELMLQMIYAELLKGKGLVDKSEQLLAAGVEKARDYDLYSLEAEFIRRRHRIAANKWKPEELEHNYMQYFADRKKSRHNQEILDRLLEESTKLFVIRKTRAYTYTAKNDFDLQIDVAFLQNTSIALTPGQESVRYSILTNYYIVNRQFNNAYHTAREWFKIEKKIFSARNEQDRYEFYMGALRNLISACGNTGRFKEVMKLMDSEWKVPLADEALKQENFVQFVYMRASSYWYLGKHHEGESFADKNIVQVMNPKYFERHAQFSVDVLTSKIMVEFSNGNYKKAMQTINEFEALGIKKTYPIYFKDCEILKILIQADTGDYALMRSLINHIIKKEAKPGNPDTFKSFLLTLKKMQSLNRHNILKELLGLFPVETIETEILLLRQLSLHQWILSRFTDKPIAEIIRVAWEKVYIDMQHEKKP